MPNKVPQTEDELREKIKRRIQLKFGYVDYEIETPDTLKILDEVIRYISKICKEFFAKQERDRIESRIHEMFDGRGHSNRRLKAQVAKDLCIELALHDIKKEVLVKAKGK